MRIYLDFILLGPAWGQPGDVKKKKNMTLKLLRTTRQVNYRKPGEKKHKLIGNVFKCVF